MFIEQYRLETNPFSAEYVRPYFASQSVRGAGRRIAELSTGQLQCLFMSGPAGVGKSALVDQALARLSRMTAVRLDPGLGEHELLDHLVRTIGPGVVEGNVTELRNILEVYLTHQAGKGQQTLIVVEEMDRHGAVVLRECESLWRLRLRNRPVVRFLFLSRSEDLVHNMMSRHEGSSLAQAHQARLSGFTLEETSVYVKRVLEGAGCVWLDELFPEDVLFDIQAFTQGVVGDIDALCAGVLDAVAEQARATVEGPRVSRATVKQVGSALHLRYDDRAWRKSCEERLVPESVQQSDKRELNIKAARLFVTSGGETIAEISLNRPRMVLGRDDGCDISLNSNFVSRYQNLFMETRGGWLLIDLNSTNGCFVNGRKVSEHYLRDGDLISIGNHTLRFSGASAEEHELESFEATHQTPRILNTVS